jgi:hypothetical protein
MKFWAPRNSRNLNGWGTIRFLWRTLLVGVSSTRHYCITLNREKSHVATRCNGMA